MPNYVYTAKNETGAEMTGKISANSKREALDAIHRLKLLPIVVEDSAKGEISIQFFKRRVSDAQIAAALLQLADLLENGMPVLHAFQTLEKVTPNPRLKLVFKNIHDRIADGESIHSAFATHADVFDELTVNVLRAGAEGAFLEDALRRVGSFLEQQAELKGKLLAALIYPIILAIVGITVVVVLLVVFVPIFQKNIYDQIISQGKTLPWVTQSLLWMRATLMSYGLYFIGVLVLLYIWIQGQLATARGIRIWDRLKMRLPVLGNIILNGAVARFCRVFGTLLNNGVPILKSLEISSQSTGNSILSDAVRRSVESVSSGETLAKPLSDAGIIPLQVMAMIGVAEEANTLETVLIKTADSLERHSARKLDMLVRIIEPMMLLLIAVAIFYIMCSLLLPIFYMLASLGDIMG